MWGRAYFCGTAGAVDEETIRNYIENQGKEEDNFTIEEQQLLKQNFQATLVAKEQALACKRLAVTKSGLQATVTHRLQTVEVELFTGNKRSCQCYPICSLFIPVDFFCHKKLASSIQTQERLAE